MNNEVINEIDNLINIIKENTIYKEYIEFLNKVNNSNEIKELTNEIRKLNKELVLTPSIELEEKLKLKEIELDEIPLYLEYKYKLEDLNNMLVVIKNKVETFIKDILID